MFLIENFGFFFEMFFKSCVLLLCMYGFELVAGKPEPAVDMMRRFWLWVALLASCFLFFGSLWLGYWCNVDENEGTMLQQTIRGHKGLPQIFVYKLGLFR